MGWSAVISATVDSRGRLMLSSVVKPGEEYAVDSPQDGLIVLCRLVPVHPRTPRTKEEVLAAIRSSRTRMAPSWEQIRQCTRE